MDWKSYTFNAFHQKWIPKCPISLQKVLYLIIHQGVNIKITIRYTYIPIKYSYNLRN